MTSNNSIAEVIGAIILIFALIFLLAFALFFAVMIAQDHFGFKLKVQSVDAMPEELIDDNLNESEELADEREHALESEEYYEARN